MINFTFTELNYTPPAGDDVNFAFSANRYSSVVTNLELASTVNYIQSYYTSPVVYLELDVNFNIRIPIKLDFKYGFVPVVSPVRIRFGDVGQPPVLIDKSIGINLGIAWFDLDGLESHIDISNETISLGIQSDLRWYVKESKQVNYTLPWYIKPLTESNIVLIWYPEPLECNSITLSWFLENTHELNMVIPWSNTQSIPINLNLNWFNYISDGISITIPITTNDLINFNFSVYYNYPDLTYVDTGLSWAFTPSRWVCSTKYRPPKVGLITIRFQENNIDTISPITLRFVPSANYCYYDNGGGPINGNPVLPNLDFKTPINPQVKRAYLMEPTLTCKRVSDNLPIVINGVTISDKRGQHTKSIDIEFSSKIDSQQAENELLLISINGYEFYAIAEQPVKREFFGSATYSSGCRSRTATLAEPWVLPISYTNSIDRSFAGMLGDMIANTGWSIELDGITDFNVPAGAFSIFGKSPIDSVSDAVKQIGAMTIIDEFTSVIKVVPQWPTAPWLMDTTTADVNLHDAVIIDWSSTIQINKLCDVVWLRGEQHGISAKVKRTGAAGNIPTTDISQQLIVDTQAARIAGTVALADTGNKELITINLPIMADLPPLTKGMLVGVTYRTDIFKATLDSVNITASMSNDNGLDVNQSITLIRHLE